MSDLNSLLETLVSEVLGGFNLSKFKAIAKTNERLPTKKIFHRDEPEEQDPNDPTTYSLSREPDEGSLEIDYAEKFLPKIGAGTSRVTFALSGGKVLKIALNSAGFAQNENEVKVWNLSKSPIITQIFDYAPNFKWVIAEIVNPLGVEGFKKKFGFGTEGEIETYFKCIFHNNPVKQFKEDFLTRTNYSKEQLKKNQEQLDFALKINDEDDIAFFQQEVRYNNEEIAASARFESLANNKSLIFLLGLTADLVRRGYVAPGDFNADHVGVNVAGQFKILDYGLTQDVYKKFYT